MLLKKISCDYPKQNNSNDFAATIARAFNKTKPIPYKIKILNEEVGKNKATLKLKINGHELVIEWIRGLKNPVRVTLDGKSLDASIQEKGYVSFKYIYIADINEFIGDIKCRLNWGASKRILIENTHQAIIMHPHPVYDFRSELNTPLSDYFYNNPSSLVFLDFPNLNASYYNLYQNMPEKIEMSPYKERLLNSLFPLSLSEEQIDNWEIARGGSASFEFIHKVQTIEMMGGNLNMCMTVNTLDLVHAMINSDTTEKLIINYNADLILVQGPGYNKRVNFPNDYTSKSRVLHNVLKLMSRKEKKNMTEGTYKIMMNYAKNYSQLFKRFYIRVFLRGKLYSAGHVSNKTSRSKKILELQVHFN